MSAILRKNKRLHFIRSNRIETIISASNDRLNGKVISDQQIYATDFIMRQIDFGFIKILAAE